MPKDPVRKERLRVRQIDAAQLTINANYWLSLFWRRRHLPRQGTEKGTGGLEDHATEASLFRSSCLYAKKLKSALVARSAKIRRGTSNISQVNSAKIC